MDIYKANSEALVMMAGAEVGLPQQATYNGIPVEEWPRVVLSPSFAPCLDAIKVRSCCCSSRQAGPDALTCGAISRIVVEVGGVSAHWVLEPVCACSTRAGQEC